jgi:hypothetical protein
LLITGTAEDGDGGIDDNRSSSGVMDIHARAREGDPEGWLDLEVAIGQLPRVTPEVADVHCG